MDGIHWRTMLAVGDSLQQESRPIVDEGKPFAEP
jgi:hypothetical protein